MASPRTGVLPLKTSAWEVKNWRERREILHLREPGYKTEKNYLLKTPCFFPFMIKPPQKLNFFFRKFYRLTTPDSFVHLFLDFCFMVTFPFFCRKSPPLSPTGQGVETSGIPDYTVGWSLSTSEVQGALVRIRINNPRSLGSRCIKETDESFPEGIRQFL